MKKIGILFGKENSFPPAFVERVNSKGVKGVEAEFVKVDELIQGRPTPYAVIIDRISQDVPFYRAYLKNAALTGTAVINNPFWWSADEKFFNNCLSEQINVPVPKTVLLPSHTRPDDTSEMSFRNLKFPMDWEGVVDYLGGFPLYMKPHSGGGWKSVYKVTSFEDLFAKYNETGQLVMMLQENIDFDAYFRCYYLGGDRVHLMPYEPRNPHHLRYIDKPAIDDPKLLKEIHRLVLKINHALGYEFNTVEFAVRGGIPYAIDYCNPAPDADLNSVGAENFEWIVENAASMAIEKALEHKANRTHVKWGTFIQAAVEGKTPSNLNGSIFVVYHRITLIVMKMNAPVRMAILDMNNNVENMGIASIKRIADRFAVVDYDVFDVRYKAEVPGLEYDIYISSGGPGDPLEVDGIWDIAYFNLLDKLWEHNQQHEDKKYAFFVCHSFQMICHHFGIGKITHRHKESFGIVPVAKTEAGLKDPLFSALHDPFYGADFRRYQVVSPDMNKIKQLDAIITAMEIGEEDNPGEKALMAVRFSGEWFGTQFHPEAHPDGMLHYLRRPEKKDMILKQFGMNTYEEMMHNALHPDRLTNTRDHVLPGFIKDALDKILEPMDRIPVFA